LLPLELRLKLPPLLPKPPDPALHLGPLLLHTLLHADSLRHVSVLVVLVQDTHLTASLAHNVIALLRCAAVHRVPGRIHKRSLVLSVPLSHLIKHALVPIAHLLQRPPLFLPRMLQRVAELYLLQLEPLGLLLSVNRQPFLSFRMIPVQIPGRPSPSQRAPF